MRDSKPERIAFKLGDTVWYTTGTLEQVCDDLNQGRPIVVWGYSLNGDRWEERATFYGTPEYVITDRKP